MMKLKTLIICAAAAAMLCSCGAYERLAYLQDMEENIVYTAPAKPDTHIAKGDILSILVSCGTPALAAPFNIGYGTYNTEAGAPDASKPSSGVGYTVDTKGDINFPVLGLIHVEGMSLSSLKSTIEDLLVSRRYIKDPVVNVEFQNFQITVMGEVNHVGNFNVNFGSIDIFQALAMAGDLTEDAQRNNVWVIRTIEGKRQMYSLNLRSKDVYYSPAFYLQQNDMVYAPARGGKFDSAWNNGVSLVTSITSIISSVAYLMLWATVYRK